MAALMEKQHGAVPYSRLRGGDAPFSLPGKAYLAPDHLLFVRQGLLFQRLFRFYFRDIEAITCRRTHTGAWLAAVLGLIAALALLVGMVTLAWGVSPFLGGVLEILGGIVAVATVINIVRGPTCVTTLHTRVHSMEIPCFSRWRTAQAAIRTLRRRVEAVQGSLTQEALAALIEESSGPDTVPRVVVGQADGVRRLNAEPPRPFRSSGLTMSAMVLMVLFSFTCGLTALENGVALFLLSQIVLALTLAVVTLALVRQYNTTVPAPVHKATWTAFLVLLIPYMVNALIAQFQAQFQAPFSAEMGFNLAANGTYGLVPQFIHGFVGLVTLVTGVVGFWVVRLNREQPGR